MNQRLLSVAPLALAFMTSCASTGPAPIEARAPLAALSTTAGLATIALSEPASDPAAPEPTGPVPALTEPAPWAPAPAAPRRPQVSGLDDTALSIFAIQAGSQTYGDDLLDAALGSPTAFALEYSTREEVSGLGFDTALVFSSESVSASDGVTSASFDLALLETLFGGRYTQRLGESPVYLYGGAGLDLAIAVADGSLSSGGSSVSASDSEVAIGGYVQAGGYVQIGRSVSAGVLVRKTLATEAFDFDLDYVQFMASIGFSF